VGINRISTLRVHSFTSSLTGMRITWLDAQHAP
jgi:hypothetical protein